MPPLVPGPFYSATRTQGTTGQPPATLRDRMLQTRAMWLRNKLNLDPAVPLMVNPTEGVPPMNLPDPVPLDIPPGLFRNHEQWEPKTGLEVPVLPEMAGDMAPQGQPRLTLKQLMLGRFGI